MLELTAATQWTILVLAIAFMSNIMFCILDPAYRRLWKAIGNLTINVFKIGHTITKASYYRIR